MPSDVEVWLGVLVVRWLPALAALLVAGWALVMARRAFALQREAANIPTDIKARLQDVENRVESNHQNLLSHKRSHNAYTAADSKRAVREAAAAPAEGAGLQLPPELQNVPPAQWPEEAKRQVSAYLVAQAAAVSDTNGGGS